MSGRQGRILIVDDSEEWRTELVETLRKGDFYANAASTATEAFNLLNETHYHIVVLDIRLVDSDPNNHEGIHLLADLDKCGLSEATKVIMLSAYGTPEQMRLSFRDHKVLDFLTKDNFDNHEFLANIRKLFEQKVNINLGMTIHWQQQGSGSEQAVLNMDIDGTRIKRNTTLQHQVAVELEDLLCGLFYKANSVLIHPLPLGQSGTAVLRVQPFYATGGGGNEVIVKFGDCPKIDEEYRNFITNVQPFMGGMRNTTVLDLRRTTHLGGIIYSLLGTMVDQLEDFGSFYRRATVEQIKDSLNRLFQDTCGNWYANHGPLQPIDLKDDYQRLFGYSPEKLEPLLSEQLKSVQGKQQLYFRHLSGDRHFTNPLLATAGLSLVHSTYTCITHGDFNQNNLLIDKDGNTWLIDFQGTGPSHILRDISALDSAIRFQLLLTNEATLEERLQMEDALCSIKRFSQVGQLTNKFSTTNAALAKAYEIVVHLRSLARQLVIQKPSDDIAEYYVALLYNAMNTLRFSSLPSGQREHAVLSASLLVDQLGGK